MHLGFYLLHSLMGARGDDEGKYDHQFTGIEVHMSSCRSFDGSWNKNTYSLPKQKSKKSGYKTEVKTINVIDNQPGCESTIWILAQRSSLGAGKNLFSSKWIPNNTIAMMICKFVFNSSSFIENNPNKQTKYFYISDSAPSGQAIH